MRLARAGSRWYYFVMQIGKNAAAAVVLAGGASRRMGRDKAGLGWNGTSLLRHLIQLLQPEFSEVMVSAQSADAYPGLGVTVVADAEPGSGPLCGVASALAATDAEWLFVVACDMPFAEASVWHALAAHASDSVDAVIPKSARGIEPLCGLYHRRCLPVFRECLRGGSFAMHDALDRVRAAEVAIDIPIQSNPFLNINTPDDYARACAHGGSRTEAGV